jgi:hypothetical protein
MPRIKSLVIPSLRSRWSRCVDAAGPRAGSEAGPAQWGRSRHGPLGPDGQSRTRRAGQQPRAQQ